ncbi:MAG: hypothetical protein LBG11_01685, partial [Bifidobacteriaceae bacterium]|nr:hypothetical protein [Bifidobacteriaceae bacterium]
MTTVGEGPDPHREGDAARDAKAAQRTAWPGPPAVLLAVLVTLVAAIAVLLVSLDGCGPKPDPDEFDVGAYCQAIAEPEVQLDASKMIDGDEQALEDAKSVYLGLKKLAPPELSDEWTLIIRDLESMLEAARGSTKPSDVDYPAFTD